MIGRDRRIGSVLHGRYRIVERIARGAIGVVYRGEQIQLGREVAIKFLHAPFIDQEQLVRRFEIEARALSRLSHPNCVSIIDYGVVDESEGGGGPYLVMDFIRGRTLRKLVERGPLTPSRTLNILRQVLAALAHAHQHGIVHRDVKAGNVVLTRAVGTGDHVRLLDFGLAKLLDASMSVLTAAAVALGTPGYISPEAAQGEEVDARSDVYSAGVLLFELLAGRKPFIADEVFDVVRMHIETPPPRLADVADTRFSDELEAVVARAIAKAPADRFDSALGFSEALGATPEAAAPIAPVASVAVEPGISDAYDPRPASGELAALFRGPDSLRPIMLSEDAESAAGQQPIPLTRPRRSGRRRTPTSNATVPDPPAVPDRRTSGPDEGRRSKPRPPAPLRSAPGHLRIDETLPAAYGAPAGVAGLSVTPPDSEEGAATTRAEADALSLATTVVADPETLPDPAPPAPAARGWRRKLTAGYHPALKAPALDGYARTITARDRAQRSSDASERIDISPGATLESGGSSAKLTDQDLHDREASGGRPIYRPRDHASVGDDDSFIAPALRPTDAPR